MKYCTLFAPDQLLCFFFFGIYRRSTLTFALDNDGIFGVDQDYTNGLFLGYTSSSITPYNWVKPLSLSYRA